MEHVRAVVNRGLDLIRTYLIRFCEDAAARSGEELNVAGLSQPITLPNSWDRFKTAFFDAREITAHDRYMRWYKHWFRGTKRPHSNTSPSDLTSSGNKRVACGQ
jgi:hypothetical protein